MWQFHVDLKRPLRLSVDLAIAPERESVLAVIGPNGAGKSTFLRALAGFGGEDQGGLPGPAWVRPLTWVPQGPSLVPHRTIREQVEWVLNTRIERAGDLVPWLDFLAAGSWLERRPRDLSGGERQRATLLRALAAKPAILALDESLGEIDAPARDGILDRLRAWADAEPERLLILTSHDFGDVARIADRVVMLKDGTVLRDGDPEAIRRAPATWEVAALVGYVARIRVGARVLALLPDGAALEPPGVPLTVMTSHRRPDRPAVRLPVSDGREEFPLPAASSPRDGAAVTVYLRGVPLESEGGDPNVP